LAAGVERVDRNALMPRWQADAAALRAEEQEPLRVLESADRKRLAAADGRPSQKRVEVNALHLHARLSTTPASTDTGLGTGGCGVPCAYPRRVGAIAGAH
jgi:hypothetical protein